MFSTSFLPIKQSLLEGREKAHFTRKLLKTQDAPPMDIPAVNKHWRDASASYQQLVQQTQVGRFEDMSWRGFEWYGSESLKLLKVTLTSSLSHQADACNNHCSDLPLASYVGVGDCMFVESQEKSHNAISSQTGQTKPKPSRLCNWSWSIWRGSIHTSNPKLPTGCCFLQLVGAKEWRTKQRNRVHLSVVSYSLWGAKQWRP